MWFVNKRTIANALAESLDECIALKATVEPRVTCPESGLYRQVDSLRWSMSASAIVRSLRVQGSSMLLRRKEHWGRGGAIAKGQINV